MKVSSGGREKRRAGRNGKSMERGREGLAEREAREMNEASEGGKEREEME